MYFPADRRFEPLPIGINQANQGNWRPADVSGQARKIIEGFFRRCIENSIAPESLQPAGLVLRKIYGGSRHF